MARRNLLPVLFATSLLFGCGGASDGTDRTAPELPTSSSTREMRGTVLQADGLTIQLEQERRDDGPVTRATFSRDGKTVSLPCTLAASADKAQKGAIARIYCFQGTTTGRIMGVVDITRADADVNMDVRYFGRAGDPYATDFETIAGAAVAEAGRLHQTKKLSMVSAAARAETDPLELVGRVRSVIAPIVGRRVEFGAEETITSVTAMISSEMTLLLDVEFASDRDVLEDGPKPIELLVGDELLSQDELEKRVEAELHLAK